MGLGGESGSQRFEIKEAFSYGYDWPTDRAPINSLTGPNVWPSPHPHPRPSDMSETAETARLGSEWRAALNTFYNRMVSTAELLVRPLGASLSASGDDTSLLSRHTANGYLISLMRLFHYFPYAQAESIDEQTAKANQNERIGSSPHTYGSHTHITHTHTYTYTGHHRCAVLCLTCNLCGGTVIGVFSH